MITEAMPSVRSVALGLWVRTGSRDEGIRGGGALALPGAPALQGHSGALRDRDLGAPRRHGRRGQRRDQQGVHAPLRAVPRRAHESPRSSCSAAMLAKPTLPGDEVDTERQVILEEIAMYEDEPQDRVHDVLAEAIHGDIADRTPGPRKQRGDRLGRRPRHREYHDAHYSAANVVVAAGGKRRARAHRRARRAATGASLRRRGRRRAPPGDGHGPAFRFYPKETEQYHVCFGGRGISRADERRFALGAPRHRVRRLELVAPLPRGPREARACLLRRVLHRAVRRRRGRRDVRGNPRGQRRRGLRDHRP